MEINLTFKQLWTRLVCMGIIEYFSNVGYLYLIPVYGRYELISLGRTYEDAFNYFCTLNF